VQAEENVLPDGVPPEGLPSEALDSMDDMAMTQLNMHVDWLFS
jgi:hypothetical protein